MIRIKNLSKKYGDFLALDRVSLTIKKGRITTLLGPNGAGKTTLMKVLTGFFEADSGVVEIDSEILNIQNKINLQSKIGYLPENTPLYSELSVWEHLDIAAKIHNIPESERQKCIMEVAKKCGLVNKLHFDISELSKGYKQRVGLAQAIIHDPEILVLDEPTTGLDPNQIFEIRDLISSWKNKKTILISTHIMQEVEAIADDVIIINDGQIVKEIEKSKLDTCEEESENNIFVFEIEIDGEEKYAKKAEEIIKAIEAVSNIRRKGNMLTIHATENCRALISKKIVVADLDLIQINLKKTSIEDVFKKITKK